MAARAPETPEGRRRVLERFGDRIWTVQAGWFPDRGEFLLGNQPDYDSFLGLERDKLLVPYGDLLIWTVPGLRTLMASRREAAAEELDVVVKVIGALRQRPARLASSDFTVDELLAGFDRRDVPFIDAIQVRRALIVAWSLGLTKQVRNDADNRPYAVVIDVEPLVRIDTADYLKPRDILGPATAAIPAPSPAPSGGPPPKLLYGRWVEKKHVGEGGQGEVLLVDDGEKKITGPLALKRLHPSKQADAKGVARFRREVAALRAIEHGNVLKLVHDGLDESPPYFVTEFHGRASFYDYVRVLRADAGKALEFVASIADGVAAAHAVSPIIVHRDLHPGNILISKDRPIVADFGICHIKGHDRQTALNEVAGPKFYVAPELADGRVDESKITPRADVYALGKLLYATFQDDLFARENYEDPDREISTVTRREELVHLNAVFAKSIRTRPEQRYAHAAEFAQAVRDLIPVVTGNYRVPNPQGGQRCQFCGRGHYHIVPEAMAFLGHNRIQADVRGLWCRECGHFMIFRIDKTRMENEWGPRRE